MFVVNKDKSYVETSVNVRVENSYCFDETTQDGKLLAKKIKDNFPYYKLVVEGDKLIDIETIEISRLEKMKKYRLLKRLFSVNSY